MARADDDHAAWSRGGDPVERPGGGGVGVGHRLDRHVPDARLGASRAISRAVWARSSLGAVGVDEQQARCPAREDEANVSASSPRLEPSMPTMICGRLVMGHRSNPVADRQLRGSSRGLRSMGGSVALDHPLGDDGDGAGGEVDQLVGDAAEQRAHAAEAARAEDDLVGAADLGDVGDRLRGGPPISSRSQAMPFRPGCASTAAPPRPRRP